MGTDEDMETIRDQYAAVNERDWVRARTPYKEDARMVIPSHGIRSGTFEGVAAISDWFAEWFGSFDESLHFEISELRELEDGRIFVVADHRAKGRLSGVEVEDQVFWTYRFADGKIAELRGYEAREDALG